LRPARRRLRSEAGVGLAVYEIILRHGGRDEARVGEVENARVGDVLRLDNLRWIVVGEEETAEPDAIARLVCIPERDAAPRRA
jgi:hypothetical protein